MAEASVSLDFSDRIVEARETPSRLESRWLLGATLAALAGRESARLRVGRYALLGELGRGGQGTVWEAEDAHMRRRVALKFVQHESLRVDSAWLRKEARAMARVEHDNIAKVFDVGQHDGRPYVVMERLHGQDLRSYADTETSSTALCAVYASAGQGLAAAHRAGVVHGDFKPSNVMVCENGAVKVLDFGLARLAEQTNPLLRPGGTPAYMAPELLAGAPPSEQSDQYAFCASFREALARRDSATVSTRLERTLMRGLEARPQARWGSMDALLAALGPRSMRRVFWVGAAGVALAAVAAAVATRSVSTTECSLAQSHAQGIWNPARAKTIEDAFASATTQGPDPAAGVRTWTRVSTRIDDYTEAWQRDYGGRCSVKAAPVRACLRDQLQSLNALLREWEHADGHTVELATEATEALAKPARCSDADAAPAQTPLDRDIAAESAAIEALSRAGKRAEATRRAEELVRHASDAAPSTYAAVLLMSGGFLRSTDPKQASQRLEASMLVSTAAGLDRSAAHAGTLLLHVQAVRLRDFAAAERSERFVTAALARFGGDPQIENSLEDTRAAVALNRGDTQQAIEILEALLERSGPDSLPPAFEIRVLHNLAMARLYLDEPQVSVAIAELERVVALETEAHGPKHPSLSGTYNTLGMAWQIQEDWTRATDSWKTALRLAESSVSDNDEVVAVLLNNLGAASRTSGDMTEAADYLTRAYDIRVASLGTEHVDTGLVASNLGMLADTKGDLEAAIRWRVEALNAFEKTLDPGHPWVAEARQTLAATWVEWGNALREHQRPQHARDAYGRAIALGTAEVTPLARERLTALDTVSEG